MPCMQRSELITVPLLVLLPGVQRIEKQAQDKDAEGSKLYKNTTQQTKDDDTTVQIHT